MDTYSLSFPPYEGTLDARYRALSQAITRLHEKHPGVFQSLKGRVTSLESVCERIVSLASDAVQTKEACLQMALELNSVLSGKEPFSAALTEETLGTLTSLPAHRDLFLKDDGVAHMVLTCLSFLV